MVEQKKKRLDKLSVVLMIIASLVVGFIIYFHFATMIRPPDPGDKHSIGFKVENPQDDFFTCEGCWLKKSNSGLWEMYLQGKPFERGVINGKLSRNLIRMQEEAFVAQINQLVPSRFYQYFLKYFIYWFNRNLDRYLPLEYKLEIYGISLSASKKFSFIGSNYQRLLNYHSAHDIGHALQNLRLVGCTSFGIWSGKSKDSSLLIGRNFDFYAGEDFAENKIVCFEKPDSGYAFMMVTWGAMIGAVSGMNEKGVTVTINAARSDVPYSARMPISILAREILQYSKNIKTAYAIAKSRETFVSEAILIGSAEDNRASIIEKSPSRIAIYQSESDFIISTNHFQSKNFYEIPENVKDRNENASLYRYKRVLQDINNEQPLDLKGVAKILRDQKGLNGRDIGMGNEKAINQLIAHHSIIFKPSERMVWISTGNWQLGPYVCYDLKKIFNNFAGLKEKREITETDKSIAPDPFFLSGDYQHFRSFKEMKKFILNVKKSKEIVVLPDSFIHEFINTNPEYFEVYDIAGDYYQYINRLDSSIVYYRHALGKEIPRWSEKNSIMDKLSVCLVKVKKNIK
jgi:isopenicillin-N N-acyltransferase like protein